MAQAVPVHLVCGFLGSGKTTLLRHILAAQPSDERLVIVVNEFGELGIDGRLLEGFDNQVRELTTGCICCTLQGDLVHTLFDVYEQFRPDRILIEASGIAEVDGLLKAVRRVGLTTDLKLGSITTLVDALLFTRREMFGLSYFNAISRADLIVLNKVDCITDQEIASHFRELEALNPRARIVPVVQGAVDRPTFLAPGTVAPLLEGEIHHHGHAEQEHFIAFSFRSENALDPAALHRWLDGLPWELFRIKGYVRLPEGTHLLNYTFRRPDLTRAATDGPTQLAFVGWKIDPEIILSGLRGCMVRD